MVVAALVGIAVGIGHPARSAVTQWLVGWNAGVWLYLALTAMSMFRADHARLRKAALAHAVGRSAERGVEEMHRRDHAVAGGTELVQLLGIAAHRLRAFQAEEGRGQVAPSRAALQERVGGLRGEDDGNGNSARRMGAA